MVDQPGRFCGIFIRRLLLGILTLFILSVLTFLLPYLANTEPSELILRARYGGTLPSSQQTVSVLKEQMGLDAPPYLLYGRWLSRVLRGNLGNSYVTLRPTVQVIAEATLNTLQLGLGAIFLITTIGLPAGIISALKRGSRLDGLIAGLSVLGISVPVYVLGFVGILLFSVYFSLLPAAGTGGFAHMVMPTLLLAIPGIAKIARLTRYAFLETMEEKFITVARAKGVGEKVITLKHVFRNALPPLITYLGLQLGWLFAGTVIIERIFGWPGVGRLLVNSVLSYDLPVIQGCVLFIGSAFVVINFLTDLTHLYLEPRIDPEMVI